MSRPVSIDDWPNGPSRFYRPARRPRPRFRFSGWAVLLGAVAGACFGLGAGLWLGGL